MTLRGASPALVRAALAERDPLPGPRGFAGRVEGQLVRDVLGRELDRLARQAGFKRRMDDHVTKYVASLTG